MADFTSEAIQKSFIKLLNKMPVAQISVKDICSDCGISRSTFYYHYPGIPELVESIARQCNDRIINEHPRIDSTIDCINAITEFWLGNKKAILHIYKSANRDIFERYLLDICKFAVTTYLDTVSTGDDLSPDDRQILIDYMQSICLGVTIFWLENNLDNKIHDNIQRICDIKQGDVQTLIARFKK